MTAYYSAQETRNLLGITHSALLNQVAAGNLRRIIPPGRRQGVYLKSEVDQLKREMAAFFAGRQEIDHKPTQFYRANRDDVSAAAELAASVFNMTDVIADERQLEWWEKNSDIDWVLAQDGEVVGFVQLLPLEHQVIEDLFSQRRSLKDLTAQDILPYTPGSNLDLFAVGIGSHGGVSLAQTRKWGQRLIKGTYDVLIDLGERGIRIGEIRARASTANCIRLLRHLGFLETPPRVDGFRDFTMPIEGAGVPWVMDYKAALSTWKHHAHDANFDANTDE